MLEKFFSWYDRRWHVSFTAGFQVGHDTVMFQVDLLHWHLNWAWGKSFTNVCCGPFSLSFMSEGAIEEQMEIMESNERG